MGAPCDDERQPDLSSFISSAPTQLTIKYPPAQPVRIMLIAMATRALPKTLPTTVGIVEKNPPFDTPLIKTKAIMGARVVDAGHIASMLIAAKMSERNSVLRDPSLSQASPQAIRPKADARLKPATNPAPVVDENPSDFVYNGRKKGGTNNGNVPTALAKKTRSKVNDLNNCLDVSANHIWQWNIANSSCRSPFDESWSVSRGSLSDSPGRREAGG